MLFPRDMEPHTIEVKIIFLPPSGLYRETKITELTCRSFGGYSVTLFRGISVHSQIGLGPESNIGL